MVQYPRYERVLRLRYEEVALKHPAIAGALFGFVLAMICVALLVARPPFVQPLLQVVGIEQADTVDVEASFEEAGVKEESSEEADAKEESSKPSADERDAFSDVSDVLLTKKEQAQADRERLERTRTPRIARIGSVDLRSPILPANLTGVLFHQASYNYALVLETKLPEADYEKAANAHKIRVNTKQTEGEWLDADALHVWRVGDVTPMDTSIDVGALPGSIVRSPVTGTVVLVKNYKLYDQIDDIEIHIQPDGHPELDCVLLHTKDPLIAAGDTVEAGITEISHVRDIEKDLYDVQLTYFTPEGVGGNHTHVQVNDATDKNYRKEKLKGAFKVK